MSFHSLEKNMLLKCGSIEKEEKEDNRLVLNYSTMAIRKSCNTSNKIYHLSKIQLVVYDQCCVLIGWATSRLYVIVVGHMLLNTPQVLGALRLVDLAVHILNLQTAWLQYVLSRLLQFPRYIKNILFTWFLGLYCKLWHLVFSTSIHDPHAAHSGHKLKWKNVVHNLQYGP